MSPWRRDLRRLLAIFHSPKRILAEIGEAPNAWIVVAALGVLLAVPLATTVFDAANPTFGNREAATFFLLPLVVIAGTFVASAVYVFVFNLFGVEARYRVVLSVALHAKWAIFVLGAVWGLAAVLVSDGPLLEEYLVSSGIEERLARRMARALNPLEIGRLVLTGLGFAFALRAPLGISFGVVFGGWLGFHSLTLFRYLLS